MAQYLAEEKRVKAIAGKDDKNPKYVVIWGKLFRTYTGTTACTGFGMVRLATKRETVKRARAIYRQVSDLILIIDLATGKPQTINL